MFKANRNQPPTIGIGSAKVSDYARSGASHPEGERRSNYSVKLRGGIIPFQGEGQVVYIM